jgi:hypothetical protein
VTPKSTPKPKKTDDKPTPTKSSTPKPKKTPPPKKN